VQQRGREQDLRVAAFLRLNGHGVFPDALQMRGVVRTVAVVVVSVWQEGAGKVLKGRECGFDHRCGL